MLIGSTTPISTKGHFLMDCYTQFLHFYWQVRIKTSNLKMIIRPILGMTYLLYWWPIFFCVLAYLEHLGFAITNLLAAFNDICNVLSAVLIVYQDSFGPSFNIKIEYMSVDCVMVLELDQHICIREGFYLDNVTFFFFLSSLVYCIMFVG